MTRSFIWSTGLAIGACLSTAAWAQHGAGAGIHEAAVHGGPADKTSTSAGASSLQARLADSPNLAARLQPLLPPNTTLQAAASGFKNQGQFIAALHVSHNLGISFDQLKTEMTGTEHDSLGKAIQDLRPTLSSKTVHSNVKLADHQTKADLQESTEPNGK